MSPTTRAVFFDVDFTLIRPGPAFEAEGYRAFCLRHGMTSCDPARFDDAVVSAAELLDRSPDYIFDDKVFVTYIRFIIERMGGHGDGLQACAEEIYREWAACEHFVLYDDVVPTFRAVKAKGCSIGLISNTHRSLADFAAHFSLGEWIEASVSSCEHGYNKPHPSIFEHALARLGVAPADAVMVGDNYQHDIEGARSVGMRAVFLNRSRGGNTVFGRPDGAARVPVIGSLLELPAWL